MLSKCLPSALAFAESKVQTLLSDSIVGIMMDSVLSLVSGRIRFVWCYGSFVGHTMNPGLRPPSPLEDICHEQNGDT